jgi:hypothetical protein
MKRTTRTNTTRILSVGLALGLALSLGACRKKGPVEQAGEEIDEAAEKVGDAINPKGPAQKAGRAIDKAVDDISDD